MKLALVLAAALCAIVAATSQSSMSTMPIFAWSGDLSRDVMPKPQSADAALAQALGSGHSDEVVMVYMLAEVSTHDMQNQKEAFTHLKEALSQAASSSFAAVPVAKVTVNDILATARVNGVSGVDVESSKLQEYLAAHPELMTNSKQDVIVVRFPANTDSASADAIIGSANKAVSVSTSDKYTSILSTTSSVEPAVVTNLAFKFFDSDMGASPQYMYQNKTLVLNAKSSMLYGPTVNLTPTLMIAILVMIYMGVLALSAYCCILSLQTPEMFEGDQKNDMNRALNPNQSN